MEVGQISRFQTDGDFASYCRMVDAKRLSNGKVKADNNQKCGNKSLPKKTGPEGARTGAIRRLLSVRILGSEDIRPKALEPDG